MQVIAWGIRAWIGLLGVLLALGLASTGAWAARSGEFITPDTRYWIDPQGQATIDEVLRLPPDALQAMERPRTFEINRGALWLRYEVPALDTARRWYLVLEGGAFTNRATLYTPGTGGTWQVQTAGDHLPVAEWTLPDRMPVFTLDSAAGTVVWLRLENHPAPLSPSLRLQDAQDLQMSRDRALLALGMYLGFGLLVLFLGWVHIRLYGDRVFIAYVAYVTCMLGFQIAFTGLGGLFFWPTLPRWNDAAPALFMLWLTAAGIWFVREVSALSRHSRLLYRFATAWSLFGFLYPVLYFMFLSPAAFKLLNLYGLLSVLLSFGLCIWAWRKGETYAGWIARGFLPLHVAYPFPALRSAGVLVGRVTAIGLDPKSFQGVVTLAIERTYQFPRDSAAKILTAGLLGDQYIGIEPGGDDQNLAPGANIAQTQSAVVLENLIGQFLTGKAADAGTAAGDKK